MLSSVRSAVVPVAFRVPYKRTYLLTYHITSYDSQHSDNVSYETLVHI